MTVRQAAMLVGQCTKTIRRHIKSGRIKALKLNSSYRIWSDELLAALKPLNPTDSTLDDHIRRSSEG